jgi:hypothetical protein
MTFHRTPFHRSTFHQTPFLFFDIPDKCDEKPLAFDENYFDEVAFGFDEMVFDQVVDSIKMAFDQVVAVLTTFIKADFLAQKVLLF